jgi:hypothetical protein
MTSRLSQLRARLVRLGRMRSFVRGLAAWSAIATALLIAILALFAIDFSFRLGITERIVVQVLAAAGVGWWCWRFFVSLWGRRESLTQTALAVERQQQIDGDLVAALEFESRQPGRRESSALASAVVDYVAAATPTLRLFEKTLPAGFARRFGWLTVWVGVAFATLIAAPHHTAAFFERLCLGSRHYPTRTRIEQIFLNQVVVFSSEPSNQPLADCKVAEGLPVKFVVRCAGGRADRGSVEIVSLKAEGTRSRLELKPVEESQRLTWLRDAAARLNDALQAPPGEISHEWKDNVLPLLQCDAFPAATRLLAAKHTSELRDIGDSVQEAIRNWPQSSKHRAILTAQLGRLNDDLQYHVRAGDAVTQPAKVKVIPRPVVQLDLIPHEPAYTRGRSRAASSAGAPVLAPEGSVVTARVTCHNKALTEVQFSLQQADAVEQIVFSPVDSQAREWSPSLEGVVAKRLTREIRYELQVRDVDGLGLETPIRGVLRMLPDQPPAGSLAVIHKVVLPTATPSIHYRATDDYGIDSLTLVVDIERNRGDQAGTEAAASESLPSVPAAPTPQPILESHRFEVLGPANVTLSDQLPLTGTYPLSLAPLKLAKGDRIKLTLEVRDYRGQGDQQQSLGQQMTSDSLALEIADENGVLAAIAEADKRSEQQLNEIIQRQLGSGEERP